MPLMSTLVAISEAAAGSVIVITVCRVTVCMRVMTRLCSDKGLKGARLCNPLGCCLLSRMPAFSRSFADWPLGVGNAAAQC